MNKTMNVRKELRRLIREAINSIGGSGGRRRCKYCLRESYTGQPQHYRVGVKNVEGTGVEAYAPCAVDVMRAALKELT
jgi:hypothetical protein